MGKTSEDRPAVGEEIWLQASQKKEKAEVTKDIATRLRRAEAQLSKAIADLPQGKAKALLDHAILDVREAVIEIYSQTSGLPEVAEYVRTLNRVMTEAESLSINEAKILDRIMLNLEEGIWEIPEKEGENG